MAGGGAGAGAPGGGAGGGGLEARCWSCGAALDGAARIALRDACPRCDASLHACRGCVNHDPAAPNQCKESQAEWVSDREAANFCEWFRPGGGAGAGRYGDAADEARRRLEALFKK